MPPSIRIAVIGDYFVGTTLFETALHRHLDGVAALSIVSAEVPWPDDPVINGDEVREFVGDPHMVLDLARDAHVLLTHVAPVTRAVIEGSPHLQIIGCCRGGPVNVNVDAATACDIPVVNAPARNSQAVVEFTIGLILAECRGIARAHTALSQGIWRGDLYRYDRTGRELHGQVIGLVGLGAVAQALVPYLQIFGLRILAFDPYVAADRFAALGVESVDLSTLLAESDIVSLHLRVTRETQGMFGAPQFAAMKAGAFFINTARGPLVDYGALYNALASGHLGGAGLDTFADEPPPPDWRLLSLPNVTLTPHIAGSSQESAQRGAEQVARDVANWFSGRSLEQCVNASSLKRNPIER
jgi:D-3-phosphoglycerate dehydrogenase / 2-oxoglutarate reductase